MKKTVTVPKGTQNYDVIKLPREGLYKLNSMEKGSMIINIKVIMPKHISNEER